MSSYEGILRVSIEPANCEETKKLDEYTRAWIEKARRYAKPGWVDKNTWLLESGWEPGMTVFESELVNIRTVDSVRKYLQGIIEQGIDASFNAEVRVSDMSGGDEKNIHRTYTSEKMRARLKK